MNTGQGFVDGGFRRDVFGWVLLTNSPAGLTLVDSAVAYNEPGIIVGEPQIVPEPSTLSFILLSAGALVVFGKPRRSRHH